MCSSTPSPVPKVLEGLHREGSVAHTGVISRIDLRVSVVVRLPPEVQRMVSAPPRFKEIPLGSIISTGHGFQVNNCLFYDNKSKNGVVYHGTSWSGSPHIDHCTFYNNCSNKYSTSTYDHIGTTKNSIFDGSMVSPHFSKFLEPWIHLILGLPSIPASEGMNIDENGVISGLS